MKRYFAFTLAWLLVFASAAPMFAQPGLPSGTPSPASSIERFLPVKGAQYNPAILSPQEFLGFELDERLADWGDITR